MLEQAPKITKITRKTHTMNAKQKSPMSFRPEDDVADMLRFVREDGLIMGKVINKALRDALTARGYGKRRVKASK